MPTSPRHPASILAALGLSALLHTHVQAQSPAEPVDLIVNGRPIYTRLVDAEYARQLAMRGGDTSQISRDQVMHGMVDEALLAQQAEKDEALMKQPLVQASLLRVRQQVLASAMRDAAPVPNPTEAEVDDYYTTHPALFADRRIYALQELWIHDPVPDPAAMERALRQAKDLQAFIQAYVQPQGLRFSINRVTQAADNLPLNHLDEIARRVDGSMIPLARPGNRYSIVYIEASKREPVDRATARPRIHLFLLNGRRMAWMAEQAKTLRARSQIELPPPSTPAPAR